jgi:hypothetical protein
METINLKRKRDGYFLIMLTSSEGLQGSNDEKSSRLYRS